MSNEDSNLATVRRYLAAIERGAPIEELSEFYAPDIVQIELPNRVNPEGVRRDFDGLIEASNKGRHVIASQRYEILNAVARGDRVALEMLWTGTLKVAFGSIP